MTMNLHYKQHGIHRLFLSAFFVAFLVLPMITEAQVASPTTSVVLRPLSQCLKGTMLSDYEYSLKITIPSPSLPATDCVANKSAGVVAKIGSGIGSIFSTAVEYVTPWTKQKDVSVTVSIDWGDDSTEDHTLVTKVKDGDLNAAVNYEHIYAEPGIYNVSVKVKDENGRESLTSTSDLVSIIPSIKVSAPSAGQTFNNSGIEATGIPIWWSAEKLSANEQMVVSLVGPKGVAVIADGVPNNGSYIWKIPTYIPAGGYQIQVDCKVCIKNFANNEKVITEARSELFRIQSKEETALAKQVADVRQVSANSGVTTGGSSSSFFTNLMNFQSETSLTVTSNSALSKPNIFAISSPQILGKFIVTVRGNPVEVRGLSIHLGKSTNGGNAGQPLLTDVILVNEFGQKIAGPVKVGNIGTTDIVFNNSIVFGVGSHEYAIRGTLNPSLWSNLDIFNLTTPSITWLSPQDLLTGNKVAISPSSFTITDVIVRTDPNSTKSASPLPSATYRPYVSTTPSATPRVVPSISPRVTPKSTPATSPTVSPRASVTPSPVASPVINQSPTPIVTPGSGSTQIITSSPTVTPVVTPAYVAPEASPSPTPSPTPTVSVPTASPSPSAFGNSRSQTGSVFDAIGQILGSFFEAY